MSALEKTPAEQLATPVQFLKGVGPRRGGTARTAGAAYAKRRALLLPPRLPGPHRPPGDRRPGRRQAASRSCGVVEDVDLRNTGTGRCVLGVLVRGRHRLPPRRLVQPAVHARAVRVRPAGDALRQAEDGRAGLGDGPSPRSATLAEDEEEPAGRHPARLSADRGPPAVADPADRPRGRSRVTPACSDEVFPAALPGEPTTSGRCGRRCRQIHFPERPARPWTGPGGGSSTRSCSFCSWRLAVKRQQQQASAPAPPLEATAKIDARIRRLFPFELTAGQEQAIAEIAADMARAAAHEPAACRATWAAARRSWPSTPCSWPWPTATRPCSWPPPKSSPGSTP